MAKLVEIKLNAFSEKKLGNYQTISQKTCQKIGSIAKKMPKVAIIHISATPRGGGVAEILRSQVPMEKSFGLESRWLVIKAEQKFFEVTKKIHNLLQGKAGFLSEKEKELYFAVNNQLKKQLRGFLKQFGAGIVVVHDPQPLPLLNAIPKNFSSFLRLHIDLSSPNPSITKFLRPIIINYNLVILSNSDYSRALPWLKKANTKIIYPAIDPCSEKNKPMGQTMAKKTISRHGVNPAKPTISQISRFDPWKDPLGVIRAYYSAKNKIPNLQLVLAGFFEAKDDPEAISIFGQVKKQAKGDPDIHLFYDLKQLKNISNNTFISALQTASQIIIQASIREGFGLTITEAMWKGKPIIARVNSGSMLQIKNNKNGILVHSSREAERAIVRLLQDKKVMEKLGMAAQRSALERFLMPRFVLDNLKLYIQNSNIKNESFPKYSIGIDIGGTKTKAALWNKQKIVRSVEISTPNASGKLKRALQDIVRKLRPDKEKFLIGIGAAGIIKSASLLSAPNISGIRNFNFRKIFPADVPLLVDNDARCFLKGELIFGASKKAGSVLGLTIGTGIGRARAKNGVVQKIKSFERPELWEKEYQQIKGGRDYDLLARFLARKLSPILKQYNPKIIIVGGGVLKNKKFFDKLRRELKNQKIKGEIKRSRLGENAVSLGATLDSD